MPSLSCIEFHGFGGLGVNGLGRALGGRFVCWYVYFDFVFFFLFISMSFVFFVCLFPVISKFQNKM